MTEEELKALAKAHGIEESVLRGFIESLKTVITSNNSEAVQNAINKISEVQSQYTSFVEDMKASGDYEKLRESIVEKMELRENTDKINGVLDLLARGVEISSAVQQIRAGEKAMADLVPPKSPHIPGASPDLQEAQDLIRARMQTPVSAPEYGAMVSAQERNRLAGLQAARTASGGQGSQFQAYAQSVNNQANNQALQNISVLGDIRRGAEGQFANIAGMKANQDINLANLRNRQHALDLNRYMMEKGSAAETASMGRQNYIQAFQNAAATLGPPLARAYTGLGEGIDDLYNQYRARLNQRRNDQVSDQLFQQGQNYYYGG